MAFRKRSVHAWRFNANLDPASSGAGGIIDISDSLSPPSRQIYLATVYEGIIIDSKFEVLRAVTMKSTVFWFVAPCNSERPQRFGEAACRLLQLGFLIGLVFSLEDGENIFFCSEN